MKLQLTGQWQVSKSTYQHLSRSEIVIEWSMTILYRCTLPQRVNVKCHWLVNDSFQKLSLTNQWYPPTQLASLAIIGGYAKTAGDHQMITKTLTDYQHNHLRIIIRRSAKTAYDHQMITRTLTDINTTIRWSLLEDLQKQQMIIRWLPKDQHITMWWSL